MLAGFFTNAAAAARSCGQNRAIAVCSVPMALCPVRRFKPSARVRRAQLTAAPGEGTVANDTIQASRDWLANTRTSALAWWIPQVAIVGGLFVPVHVRAAIWIIALIWMGTACILNARRCNRTHCRYTGPYYLAMIVPVLALGSDAFSVGFYGWLALACVILLGSKLIWWATERAWGKFS
jgi:hypothetical protein